LNPKIRVVPIAHLILDEKNVNKGTKRGRELLGESLERYGAARSVVVDRKNRVIAGNKTVEAARAAGMKSISVIETDGSSLVAVQRGDLDLKRDKKARELAIADNRVGEIDLDWNPEVLATLDADLSEFWSEGELNSLLKGFRSVELSAPEPKIDQAAKLQKKWNTKRGQIWKIGSHRLMCGDSANPEDVQTLMDGSIAKLCATDPPYLVSYDAKNHPSKDFSDGKNKDWKGRYADKQKSEALGPFYEGFLKQALSFCDSNAAIYIWHASQRQVEVEQAMRNSGILVHQQIIWVKNKPVLTHSFYMWQHEPCFFGWVKGNKPIRRDGEYPTTVWTVDVPILPGKESRHPTEKPLELFAKPMRLHTDEDDVCYEPFSGSGTQLAAAEILKRRCFAMEIEPAFVAVALERVFEMGLKPELVPG
jgi:DNA modification methylase